MKSVYSWILKYLIPKISRFTTIFKSEETMKIQMIYYSNISQREEFEKYK